VLGQAPDPRLGKRLDTLVERASQLNLSPGFSVAVVRDDSIVYLKGSGVADVTSRRPVSPETPFYIASTTKALTALAVACLASEGKIDLDAPLSTFLPTLKLKPPLSTNSITLHSLLAMKSGIAGGPVDFRMSFTGEGSRDQLLKQLETHEALKSGNEFFYSNLPYQVAGMALEEKFGKSWKDIVKEKVLDPLGMDQTRAHRVPGDTDTIAAPHAPTPDGFRRIHFGKDDSNLHAAGGHLSSARDLARLVVTELNDGRARGRQVIPRVAILMTQRVHATQDRKAGPIHRHAWGLGWDIGTLEGQTIVHRPGGFLGFQSHVSFMPERKVGVVILANGGSIAGALVDVLLTGIYDQVLERPDAQGRFDSKVTQVAATVSRDRQRIAEDGGRRSSRPQTLAHDIQAYVGTYANPVIGHMVWTAEDGKLAMRMGAAVAEVEVFDGQTNKLRVDFTGTGSVAEFRFSAGEAKASSVFMMGQEFFRE
jgi:CubicO group peptidase (beta-lactamase class C family)